MDNTDPLRDHQSEDGGHRSPLEVHSPNMPPIEYADGRDARVIALLTFLGTVRGKMVLAAATALLLGGSVWHFAHHRKPATQPVAHIQATRAASKHVAAKNKPAATKSAAHKSTKKSTAKTTKKNSTKKKSAHSNKSTPKSQSKPWFSSRESNG